ncbi:MAG: hypothetical protein L7F77_16000, partial [Candidatus Magnetominusculus sp. LBB02]|nr:hypothetical protein [Candidatus Magnetominusculus sp. LBB02]
VFFAVWGVFLLYVAIQRNKVLLLAVSGLCLGMAFVMKQHGIFFLFFAVAYLYLTRGGFRDFLYKVIVITASAALPFAVILFTIYRGGALSNFWFWCFTYSGKYVTSVLLMDGLARFNRMALKMMGHFTVFWISGIIGFFLLIQFGIQPDETHKRRFLMLFSLFSFLSILPGLYFREHYFVLVIPALSILAAYCSELLANAMSKRFKGGRWLPISLLILSLIFTFTAQGRLYFKLPPDDVSTDIYGLNPFVQSVKIAQYLKSHAAKGDRIAVLGSEPQILFYSGMRSVTGYIYMYGLMEDQPYNLQMQHEMSAEIEKGRPAFIVFANIPTSWLPLENSPLYIFDWAKDYIDKNYILTGVVDIIYYNHTVYKFDAEALNYNPQSGYYVSIYRRKDHE